MATLSVNKRARYDFEFLKTYEAGLVLTGAEVKSIKAGHVQLKGAYMTLRRGELFLRGAHVSPYTPAGSKGNTDPGRERKVLVRKRELSYLAGKLQASGLTLVPIRLYTKARQIKLEFALARGKKKFEKRQIIKKRELDQKIREAMKM